MADVSIINNLIVQLPLIIAALGSLVAAVVTAVITIRSANKIDAAREIADSTHSILNSRLTQWKEETREAAIASAIAALAEGVRIGRAQILEEQKADKAKG